MQKRKEIENKFSPQNQYLNRRVTRRTFISEQFKTALQLATVSGLLLSCGGISTEDVPLKKIQSSGIKDSRSDIQGINLKLYPHGEIDKSVFGEIVVATFKNITLKSSHPVDIPLLSENPDQLKNFFGIENFQPDKNQKLAIQIDMYEGTLIQEDGHNALINIGQLEGINLKNNKGDVIGNVEGLIKRGENSIVATAPADTQTSFVGLFIKQKNQQNETYALFIPTREAIQEDLTLIT